MSDKENTVINEYEGREITVLLEHWKRRKRRMKILRRSLIGLVFCAGLGLGVTATLQHFCGTTIGNAL